MRRMAATAQQRWAVVTGAGSGIGRALAVKLARERVNVVAVGRRREKLEETVEAARRAGCGGDVVAVVADVATVEGRDAVASETSKRTSRLEFLVHNAGVVGPLVPLEKLDLDKFRHTMLVDVEAPIFLTQKLLPLLDAAPAGSHRSKSRVLHISSGCAHRPTSSWLTYCTAKAAFLMAYRVLALEFRETNRNVLVGSVKPGIVTSEMQDEMRLASKEDFPSVDKFKRLKQSLDKKAQTASVDTPPTFPDRDALDTPENVAHFLWFLLDKTTEEEFDKDDWDIRDEAIASRWVSPPRL